VPDPNVAAFRPPELLESLAERRVPGLCFRVAPEIAHQYTDPLNPFGLLRARRERPRGHRAPDRGYQFPPSDVDWHLSPLRAVWAVSVATTYRASTILGSRIVKVDPRLGSLSTVISPPII
jgi:hypothetical protein